MHAASRALIVLALGFACQSSHLSLLRAACTSGNSQRYYLPPAQFLRTLSLGYDSLIADFFWLEFIQYVGANNERAEDKYVSTEQFIELITALDATLVQSYYFSTFIIGGDLHRPKVADKFLQRGILANPDNWYLFFIAGINQYLFAHNEIRAAEYYDQAAVLPAAPRWLKRQAIILRAQLPSTLKTINVWNSIYESPKDARVAERARLKLMDLWAKVRDLSQSTILKQRASEQLLRLKESG